MKKSIVLAILGVAAGATASYGQGTVNFSNYYSTSSPTVNYANSNVPVGKAGLSLGSEFSAELAWATGVVGSTSSLAFLASTITPFGLGGPSTPAADGQASVGAGWYNAGTQILAASGLPAGTVVTLDVFAFNNGSLGASTINGSSGLFQVTVGGGTTPPATLNGTVAGHFLVANAIPEPTTMALGGLGLAALMLFRRKQV
jgi:hypothetical protein